MSIFSEVNLRNDKSGSNWSVNRNILRQIQEELPKHLQKAGVDIEHGEVNSEAVHRTVKQYKADMEKEKEELATVICYSRAKTGATGNC